MQCKILKQKMQWKMQWNMQWKMQRTKHSPLGGNASSTKEDLIAEAREDLGYKRDVWCYKDYGLTMVQHSQLFPRALSTSSTLPKWSFSKPVLIIASVRDRRTHEVDFVQTL